jgi:hypothetical protein
MYSWKLVKAKRQKRVGSRYFILLTYRAYTDDLHILSPTPEQTRSQGPSYWWKQWFQRKIHQLGKLIPYLPSSKLETYSLKVIKLTSLVQSVDWARQLSRLVISRCKRKTHVQYSVSLLRKPSFITNRKSWTQSFRRQPTRSEISKPTKN